LIERDPASENMQNFSDNKGVASGIDGRPACVPLAATAPAFAKVTLDPGSSGDRPTAAGDHQLISKDLTLVNERPTAVNDHQLASISTPPPAIHVSDASDETRTTVADDQSINSSSSNLQPHAIANDIDDAEGDMRSATIHLIDQFVVCLLVSAFLTGILLTYV